MTQLTCLVNNRASFFDVATSSRRRTQQSLTSSSPLSMALAKPFAVWSHEDHSGPIIIVTTLCAVYWVVACVLQQLSSYLRGLRDPWSDSFLMGSMVLLSRYSKTVMRRTDSGPGCRLHTVSGGTDSVQKWPRKIGRDGVGQQCPEGVPSKFSLCCQHV